VAPPLAFSNSAIQAFWAASWAVEPAPAISPEASLDGAPPRSDSLSLVLDELLLLDPPPPQAAKPSTSTQAAANTASHLELDISLLFKLLTKFRAVSGTAQGRACQRREESLLSGCVERVNKM
jgi:hypothetical protein